MILNKPQYKKWINDITKPVLSTNQATTTSYLSQQKEKLKKYNNHIIGRTLSL